MEETICKSCILAFMNATCTFCMINIVSKLFKHELMIFDCPSL